MIELKYFNTIGHQNQWFILYEFVNTYPRLFQKSDIEILDQIISTRILSNCLYHGEMEGFELELKGLCETPGRPFNLKKVDLRDFQLIKSREDFYKWLQKFRTDGWKDDQDDAQILIDKAEKELWSRTNLKNGVWHLSKDCFNNDSDKLIEDHLIYLHFETFIEIDRKNKLIRTFDFGYD